MPKPLLTCLVALATTCAAAAVAAAEPTADDLAARATALRHKLAGLGYTVLIEPPFVVVGDSPAAQVDQVATHFLRRITRELEAEYFAKRPEKLIEVWLFKNENSFRRGAAKYFGDAPDTPFGYYSPEHSALIMNIDGLGTLSHELVHPYMEANFPAVPSWFNEGVASLYERPSERAGHIVGLVNWRLPNLKKEIRAGTLPSLAAMMTTTDDGFYQASWDAYAQARYLMYYLQEHKQLHDYYERFRADTADPTGQAALVAVLGESLETFEPAWRKWVLALPLDR